jgi:hypothetical protein
VGRLQFLFDQVGIPRRVGPLMVTLAFIAWPMINEWRKRGSVHLAWWIGGGVLLLSVPLRGWLGGTEFWLGVAHPLIRWVS